MIDASTYKVHGIVPTGMEHAHIILLSDSKTAYATNGANNTLSVIDVESMKTIATIPVGESPHGQRPSLMGGGSTLQTSNPIL